MNNIKELLDNNYDEITNANYQLDKIYDILGENEVEANEETFEQICEWMSEKDLLGANDAYEELLSIKYQKLIQQLKEELLKLEHETHEVFNDNKWTYEHKIDKILEFSAVVKVYQALIEGYDEVNLLEIKETLEDNFNLKYFVNKLANSFNNYNLTNNDVYGYVHTLFNGDTAEEQKYIIVTINEDCEEVLLEVEAGVTAQHALDKFLQKHVIDENYGQFIVKNINNEIEAKFYI